MIQIILTLIYQDLNQLKNILINYIMKVQEREILKHNINFI